MIHMWTYVQIGAAAPLAIGAIKLRRKGQTLEKPLSMLLLTLGGFITAAVLLATLTPTVTRTGNAIVADREGFVDQTSEDITLVNAFSELDSAATWQDTDSDTYFDIWMWTKNTGTRTIPKFDNLDVFVHSSGTSERIPHADDAGVSYPQWTAAVEGETTWLEDATLKITVHYSGAQAAGDYTLEVVTPVGAKTVQRFTF